MAQTVVLVVVLTAATALLVLLRRGGRRDRADGVGVDDQAQEITDKPWVAVIANPTKVDDVAARQSWIHRTGQLYGLASPVWLETTPEDPGCGQARTAVDIGAEAVLAYGGDGTVRAVATGLANRGVPLGLLPAGTGNLLARNLAIPYGDLDTALQIALGGKDRPLDVGRAQLDVSGEDQQPREETFLVMAGLGFDAEVMASVEPRLKERVGWWAYVVAGSRLLRGRQTKVTIRMDDRPSLSRRVRSVIVGNCGELTAGVRLLPDARPDDGLLDVVVVAPRGVVGWAAVTAAVLSGSRRGHPVVERFQCRDVEIRAEKPLRAQLDGDPAGEARVLRARVDPMALSVRVDP